MIRFNQTIEKTIEIVSKRVDLGQTATKPRLVRGMTGAMTVILPDDLYLDPTVRQSLAEELHENLGPYSLGEESILLTESDLFDREDVWESPHLVESSDEAVLVMDRTLSNQEWLREPVVDTLPIPTATAFSIKGGVGRSTAVAVWAWGLARQGKRVLVIDLDLEAPGIASLLLNQLPTYGVVDWMMESLVQQADDALLTQMIQNSPLSTQCEGTIQVIPAYGTEGKDYVSKLGRIYTPTWDVMGQLQSIAFRLNALLNAVANFNPAPDVVLLDARAGLHDIGAMVISQLPTKVFLFARNEAQTWPSYQRLFDHLQQSRCVQPGMPNNDIRWRLKMVAAQLGREDQDFEDAVRCSHDTWKSLYDAPLEVLESHTDRPHYPIPIYSESLLSRKSLVLPGQCPPWSVVEKAFGRFITEATARLFETKGASDHAETR
ncbi:conserved hypothetical protein [uncultured Gammaproteobacteria bacterium]